MSTETHVLHRGALPTKAALARAMQALDCPFALTRASGSIARRHGFMPMRMGREESGVEVFSTTDPAAVEELAAETGDHGYRGCVSFRWSSDFQEAVAGMCTAAALAKLADGVVLDEAENKLLSVDEAIALARRNLAILLARQPKPRLGTSPADLKRYLRPLLEMRSDLVLIGRLLIIRPVRHLIRGAYFDSSGDRYRFNVSCEAWPLFPVGGEPGTRIPIHSTEWQVWDPHFEPFLLHCMAEDVFARVAKIDSLAAFARDRDVTCPDGYDRFQSTRVVALVLAGERERAAALVERLVARPRRPANGEPRRKSARPYII